MSFKKLLVPLDRSKLNYKVLSTALSLADRFESEVVVLRIRRETAVLDMDEQDATRVDLNIIEQETQEIVDEAMKTLREGHTVTAKQVTADVRSGAVVDTIVAAADELMADLIIMGTHGRKGVAEFFTGSTTEQVVARAVTSVMVIKPSGFPFLDD